METILYSILIVLGVLLLFAAALLIFRAMMYGRSPDRTEEVDTIIAEGGLIAEHLATAVRIQTVSQDDKEHIDYGSFDKLLAALEKMYPRLHATLRGEAVNGYSRLYTWPGKAPDLDPVLLYGHMDVVPADPVTLAEWTHPPFSGVVADGCVWGRGTLDMKGNIISMMEAIEGLIKTGYQPERTLFLTLGHDEEIGGMDGARQIAGLLEGRGVHLAALFDEGGPIMDGLLPGLTLPAALVGVAEKGHASLELKVEGRPGHSSMPPRHTAIGILARALARIEANPMPARLSMVRLLLDELGLFLPFSNRLALANSWLFNGALRSRFEKSPSTNAMIRTTAAVTVIQGGVKDNVLPAQARAIVNCRLLPGDTLEKVLAYFRKVVNDEAVQVTILTNSSWEASPVSSVDSPVYKSLSHTIRQVFPEVLVAPYLVSGATDSRHFMKLTTNVFRFSPYRLDNQLLRGIHGIDERISIESLERMVKYYAQLIKTWTTAVGTAE